MIKSNGIRILLIIISLIILLLYVNYENDFEHFTSKNKTTPRITTIITTSPIQSMDGSYFKETIDSLKHIPELKNSPIVICFDGGKVLNDKLDGKCKNLNDEIDIKQYEDYKNEVKKYVLSSFPNVVITEAKERICLTQNIHNGMKLVKTKFVNVMQHDLPIIKSFDLDNIIKTIDENDYVKYVRYVLEKNRFHEEYNKKSGAPILPHRKIQKNGLTFSICSQWSDQNHITTKKYYDDIIFPETLNKFSFMEHDLLSKPPTNHKRYGTWYLGDLDDGNYIYHSNARGANKRK